MSNNPVIHVKGLTRHFKVYQKEPGFWGAVKGLIHRRYETVTAVQNVSFDVQEGELVGFLGPNGAGKTTTLKMLSGLLFPSGGEARVLGYTPWNREDGYRRQFALLLGQKNQLWWDLPARESLELNSKIYGIPKDQYRKSVDDLTAMLQVGHKLNVMVRELSLGERMKMELVAALLHRPRVLFLDEPTLGLDVISQKIVREFLKEYNQREKTTILLTSHYMADIEALCRRVIIIDRGSVYFDGALGEVLDRFAGVKLVTLHYKGQEPADASLHPFGEVVEKNPGSITLRVPREKVITVCKRLLDEIPINDIDIKETPTEEIVRQIFIQSQKA
jgi:ABC-2 type transport system ATP-binding protein